MKNQVHHVVLFVKDIDRSITLYHDFLGFEVEWRVGPIGGRKMSAIIGIPKLETEIAYLKSSLGPALELLQLGSPEYSEMDALDFGMPGSVGVSIQVMDIENLHRRFSKSDWEPLTSCQQVNTPAGESMKVFCIRTDEGVVIELLEPQNGAGKVIERLGE
jgi:catechol 2,3-dioxygenase-like lactoylglutathione lyase family enzyme